MNMDPVIVVWLLYCGTFVAIPTAHYWYMKRWSSRPWGLTTITEWNPSVTVLVPTRNEERTIALKLENLREIKYPKDRLEVIVIDDKSTDATIARAEEFRKDNGEMNIKILIKTKWGGKSESLNLGLQESSGEVVVVSDADCFWTKETLPQSLKYLSNPTVGAVTGLESILNPPNSIATRSEVLYDDIVHVIRVGESKIQSTVIFQGGFSAYKRGALDRFDTINDDSGTALSIIQKGLRTILVPEALVFTSFPVSLAEKAGIKLRRAVQLIKVWLSCLRLLLKNKLRLSLRVFIPEFYLYFLQPPLFVVLAVFSALLAAGNFWIFMLIICFLAPVLVVPKLRMMFGELVQGVCILLLAMISVGFGRTMPVWKSSSQSRSVVTREALEALGLLSN